MNDPGKSPYYSAEFFDAIKQVVQGGLLNVASMSTKQWHRVLLENNVTMQVTATNQEIWKPVKCEARNPAVLWDRSWNLSMTSGLSSEQTSFLFKMLHNILPTKSRLFRLHQKDSPACTLCTSGSSEDCLHALVTCSFNSDVKNWILDISSKVAPH